MTDKQWFIDQFDSVVSGSPEDGATVEKSRDEVAHRYADEVERDPGRRRQHDLIEEGRMLFDREVGRERDRRRGTLKKDAEYIRDALLDNTVLGPADPILDRAYPLGNGSDKTLRYWSPADWINAVRERDELAEDAKRAAREFGVIASEIVTAMASRGVTMTGRLFDEAA